VPYNTERYSDVIFTKTGRQGRA